MQDADKFASQPGRPTVLLVEDDEQIRSSTAEMVRELGYPVVLARSAEEAMQFVRREDIGILMADIGLPGMSGDVYAAEVRCIRPTMAIVFATGKAHFSDSEPDSSGPVLLRKPYGIAALKSALETALRRVRA